MKENLFIDKSIAFVARVMKLHQHFIRTNLIDYNFDELLSLAEEIKRMLISSLNTVKEKIDEIIYF